MTEGDGYISSIRRGQTDLPQRRAQGKDLDFQSLCIGQSKQIDVFTRGQLTE